ncbi:hypothetical protein ML401_06965 [Bradyrhizobium sp. 62B]|uniref:hypothetical protein n=1 Tax=Bradyrhizobium sp. 62B TaxID=2898442 RepID=UPI002557E76E|nr:hypothetical protein ML401_06965 [Bradyrhizobium sp. 62B]
MTGLLHRANMHEYIRPASVRLDETVTFRHVEPLNRPIAMVRLSKWLKEIRLALVEARFGQTQFRAFRAFRAQAR